MPAQPLPARGAGEFVIRYVNEGNHVRATLFRRANTGALVELGTERVSYALAQDTLAGEDDSVPYSDELGWDGDPDELGALGGRIKKFAKKVAKSKLGQIAKKVGKMAVAVVPGGNYITTGVKAAKTLKKGVQFAKSLKKKPKPRPAPVDIDAEAAADEVGAVAKKPAPKKPAPKKPAPKKPAAKPKPKAAPKPAAKKPAPKKPAAKPKPKAAPKPAAKKPAPKKPAAKKTAPKPKPKAAAKPATSAAAKLAKVKSQGGAAATLAKSAAAAPTPAKAAQAAKLAQLVEQIEDDAPELAATLAMLPDTDPDERDGVELRAVQAAQELAATAPEDRPALAAKMENRIDGYKVTDPDGNVTWIPIEEVEGPGGGGGEDDDEEED
jgi:hypothetical protein